MAVLAAAPRRHVQLGAPGEVGQRAPAVHAHSDGHKHVLVPAGACVGVCRCRGVCRGVCVGVRVCVCWVYACGERYMWRTECLNHRYEGGGLGGERGEGKGVRCKPDRRGWVLVCTLASREHETARMQLGAHGGCWSDGQMVR